MNYFVNDYIPSISSLFFRCDMFLLPLNSYKCIQNGLINEDDSDEPLSAPLIGGEYISCQLYYKAEKCVEPLLFPIPSFFVPHASSLHHISDSNNNNFQYCMGLFTASGIEIDNMEIGKMSNNLPPKEHILPEGTGLYMRKFFGLILNTHINIEVLSSVSSEVYSKSLAQVDELLTPEGIFIFNPQSPSYLINSENPNRGNSTVKNTYLTVEVIDKYFQMILKKENERSGMTLNNQQVPLSESCRSDCHALYLKRSSCNYTSDIIRAQDGNSSTSRYNGLCCFFCIYMNCAEERCRNRSNACCPPPSQLFPPMILQELSTFRVDMCMLLLIMVERRREEKRGEEIRNKLLTMCLSRMAIQLAKEFLQPSIEHFTNAATSTSLREGIIGHPTPPTGCPVSFIRGILLRALSLVVHIASVVVSHTVGTDCLSSFSPFCMELSGVVDATLEEVCLPKYLTFANTDTEEKTIVTQPLVIFEMDCYRGQQIKNPSVLDEWKCLVGQSVVLSKLKDLSFYAKRYPSYKIAGEISNPCKTMLSAERVPWLRRRVTTLIQCGVLYFNSGIRFLLHQYSTQRSRELVESNTHSEMLKRNIQDKKYKIKFCHLTMGIESAAYELVQSIIPSYHLWLSSLTSFTNVPPTAIPNSLQNIRGPRITVRPPCKEGNKHTSPQYGERDVKEEAFYNLSSRKKGDKKVLPNFSNRAEKNLSIPDNTVNEKPKDIDAMAEAKATFEVIIRTIVPYNPFIAYKSIASFHDKYREQFLKYRYSDGLDSTVIFTTLTVHNNEITATNNTLNDATLQSRPLMIQMDLLSQRLHTRSIPEDTVPCSIPGAFSSTLESVSLITSLKVTDDIISGDSLLYSFWHHVLYRSIEMPSIGIDNQLEIEGLTNLIHSQFTKVFEDFSITCSLPVQQLMRLISPHRKEKECDRDNILSSVGAGLCCRTCVHFDHQISLFSVEGNVIVRNLGNNNDSTTESIGNKSVVTLLPIEIAALLALTTPCSANSPVVTDEIQTFSSCCPFPCHCFLCFAVRRVCSIYVSRAVSESNKLPGTLDLSLSVKELRASLSLCASVLTGDYFFLGRRLRCNAVNVVPPHASDNPVSCIPVSVRPEKKSQDQALLQSLWPNSIISTREFFCGCPRCCESDTLSCLTSPSKPTLKWVRRGGWFRCHYDDATFFCKTHQRDQNLLQHLLVQHSLLQEKRVHTQQDTSLTISQSCSAISNGVLIDSVYKLVAMAAIIQISNYGAGNIKDIRTAPQNQVSQHSDKDKANNVCQSDHTHLYPSQSDAAAVMPNSIEEVTEAASQLQKAQESREQRTGQILAMIHLLSKGDKTLENLASPQPNASNTQFFRTFHEKVRDIMMKEK